MSDIKQASRHRVLIVDDEEGTRLLLARILSNDMEVEVMLAGTCEQAVRLGGGYAYDAILLDLMMPGVGGFGVLKALRANSPNLVTPIIIVSSISEPEMVERCMSAGASAYVVKPVERNSLTATVRAQIAGRAQPQT